MSTSDWQYFYSFNITPDISSLIAVYSSRIENLQLSMIITADFVFLQMTDNRGFSLNICMIKLKNKTSLLLRIGL